MIGYRPEIDGLRAIAISLVVIYHAFPTFLPGGFTGVDVFFVISGFLITGILLAEYESKGISLRGLLDFYIRRVRRLFPALLVVLTSCLVAGWFFLFPDEYEGMARLLAAGAAFLANIQLWRESGYFDTASEEKPLLHLWSLGVEEQFYIFWPLILMGFLLASRNIWPLIASVVLFSFVLSIELLESDPVAAFYLPISRMWQLLSGALLAVWAQRASSANFRSAGDPLVIAGFALIAIGAFIIDEKTPFPGWAALLPVAGSAMIIAGGNNSAIAGRILASSPAVLIGLISYPLYLWHWPILSFLRITFGEVPASVRVAAIGVSVGLAWATWRYVERQYRRASGSSIVGLVASMIILALTGFVVSKAEGVPTRTPSYVTIESARNDWAFPGMLTERRSLAGPYYASGDGPSEVLFYGDSHAEQYAPRVALHSEKGDARGTAFATRGGCIPIPGVRRVKDPLCDNLPERFSEVLRIEPIETIIIALNFYSLLDDDDSDGAIVSDFGSPAKFQTTATLQGRTLVLRHLRNFVERLAKDYDVVVLLDNPTGSAFDPRTLIAGAEEARRPLFVSQFAIADSLGFERDEAQIEIDRLIVSTLQNLNVQVIEQSNKVCPDDRCSPIASDGRPIYKDTDHMRPWFVRDRMDVLDGFLVARNVDG